jgi:hypothetical protein
MPTSHGGRLSADRQAGGTSPGTPLENAGHVNLGRMALFSLDAALG